MSNKIFAYAAIAAVLSWPEDHKPGEEGLFLQPEEAEALNNAVEAGTNAATELATAKGTINTLTAEIETLKTAAPDTDALNQRIAELEAENKLLGGERSGNGTKLDEKDDPPPVNTGGITLMDANHPLNRHATAVIAARKKFKNN